MLAYDCVLDGVGMLSSLTTYRELPAVESKCAIDPPNKWWTDREAYSYPTAIETSSLTVALLYPHQPHRIAHLECTLPLLILSETAASHCKRI